MAKLGSGQITLTDLTDIRPARMDLAASLGSIQSQVGEVYDPDYEKSNQVITPTVFFGNEEAEVKTYYDKIVYNYNEKEYKYSGIFSVPIYVDKNGSLVIKENLIKSGVVKATIPSLTDTKGLEYTNISETFDLHKVSYDSGYQLWIESKDNRYDFSSSSTSDITLSFKAYSGTRELGRDDIKSIQWSKGREKLDGGTGTEITIKRIDIDGHETYILEVVLITGVKLRAQVGIDDRTDNYYSEIIAAGTTLLTPKNKEVFLTCQVWDGNKKVETTDTTISIEYEWMKGEKLIENEKTASITFTATESTTIFCRATIKKGEKVVGQPLSYIAIQYTVPYEVVLSRDTIFVPCYSNNKFRGDSFTEEINFKIIGDDGKPLSFNDGDSIEIGTAEHFTFEISPEDSEKWDKTITIKLKPTETDLGGWDSQTHTIEYTYLGNTFSKDFSLIKNYQGQDGVAAITLDLTNSFHRFAGTQAAALPDQEITFGYTAKIAENDLDISKIRVGDYVFLDKEAEINYKDYYEIITGLYLKYDAGSKIFTLRTRRKEGNEDNLKIESGIFSIYFTVSYNSALLEKEYRKDFSYGYTITGDSYLLEVSPQSIIYSPANNSFSANAITITPKRRAEGRWDYINLSTSDCIVMYSTDGEKFTQIDWSAPFPITSNQFTQYIFRLLPNDEEKAPVLDEETIPLITSMDGIEIGGENLLRWTKKMPDGEGKWDTGAYLIENEDNFGIATLGTLISPRFKVLPEMIGKSFCLSYYSNNDTTSDVKITVNLSESLTQKDEEEKIYKYSFPDNQIFNINSGTGWCRISTNFIFDNNLISQEQKNEKPKIENIESMFLEFSSSSYEKTKKVKKFKLEIGNIPTDWSESPYDTDIMSENMAIASEYQISIDNYEDTAKNKKPYRLFAKNLKPDTTYMFSYEEANFIPGTGDEDEEFFCCEIIPVEEEETPEETSEETPTFFDDLKNTASEKQILAFTTPKSSGKFDFYIYACNEKGKKVAEEKDASTLNLLRVKLEEGTESTPFFLEDNILSDLMDSIVDMQTDYDNRFTLMENKYYIDDGYLEELKSAIELNTNGTNPYIGIYTSNGKETFFGTKIDNSSIGFYNQRWSEETDLSKVEPVAYINKDELNINKASFRSSFNIGKLKVVITESGVGFTW